VPLEFLNEGVLCMFSSGTVSRMRVFALALVGSLFTALACVSHRRLVAPSHALAQGNGNEARFHLRNGELLVASSWRPGASGQVQGTGTRYSLEREVLSDGPFTLARDEIALVEVQRSQAVPSFLALGVVSTASAGMTVYCIAQPKACFGSCPTFYVTGPDGALTLQAEGFSTSVARRLEANDVDLLPEATPRNGYLELEVRNEAPETHYLRRVALDVVEGPAGTQVHRLADGGYVALGPPVAPRDAPDLAAVDGIEQTLGSDGVDLAARASITLAHPPVLARRAAVLLTARNSLMNTWVFYHLLARLGPEMGRFFAALERGDATALGALRGFDEALGGIDVWVRQDGEAWCRIGTFGYLGPIAPVTQAIAFDIAHPDAGVEVRLDFARAHWRFDRVALAPVHVEGLGATTLDPEVVGSSSTHDRDVVTRALRGEGERAVTLPGDRIRLRFRVPEASPAVSRSYFVRSRGYYYEWAREAWQGQADPRDAMRLLADPRAALRELAPLFAQDEPALEAVFRASRLPVREKP